MTVDKQDLGKEIGRVDEAGEEDKTEIFLAGPFPNPIETHVD